MRDKQHNGSHTRRRRYVALTAVALAAIGTALWFIVRSQQSKSAPDPQVSANSFVAWPATAWPTAIEASKPATVALQRPLADDEFELCGYGRVKRKGFKLPAEVRDAAQAAMLRWADREVASEVEVERARGLLFRARLRASMAQESTATRLAGAQGDPFAVCDGPCREEARRAATQAALPDIELLARLASTTRDPGVYAMALVQCGRSETQRSVGNCGLLSAAQWARLDPANGMPWLFLAAEASAREDPQSRDEALFRATKAQQLDLRWQPVLEGVVAMSNSAGNPTERTVAYRKGIDIAAGLEGIDMGINWVLPQVSHDRAVYRACNRAAVRESNRRQLCSDVANLLAEKGTTPAELALGRTIGEVVGWPAERLARLRGERGAVQAAVMRLESEHPIYSCAWTEALLDNTAQRARIGQMEADRALIAASGRSAEDLAAEWRERLKRLNEKRSAKAAKAADKDTMNAPR